MLLFPMEYQPLASQGEQIMESREKHLKTDQEAAVIVKDVYLWWVIILGEVEVYVQFSGKSLYWDIMIVVLS